MAQVRVGRGQHKLAELIEVEHVVLGAVVLAHYILRVDDAWVEELLAHEVVDFVARDLTVPVCVQMVEELHGLEVWVTGKVLSAELNLYTRE